MSRVGLSSIKIPEGVTVTSSGILIELKPTLDIVNL